jgi:hypothetical protein
VIHEATVFMNNDYSGQDLRIGRSWIRQMAENGTGVSGELNIRDIEIRRIGRNAGIRQTSRRIVGVHHAVSAYRRNRGGNTSGVAGNSLDQLTPIERAIDVQMNELCDWVLSIVKHIRGLPRAECIVFRHDAQPSECKLWGQTDYDLSSSAGSGYGQPRPLSLLRNNSHSFDFHQRTVAQAGCATIEPTVTLSSTPGRMIR